MRFLGQESKKMPDTNDLIKELLAKGKRKTKIQGKVISIYPEVFYYFDSEFLSKNLKIPKNSSVLDIGTGTGVQAITASKKARKVLAIDISPKAIKNSRENVKKLNLSKKIRVMKSNLFEKIKEKFDVIVFNIPFNPKKEGKTPLEIATYDKGGKLLRRFLSNVKKYLNPKGKVILAFSSFGRTDILKEECKKQKLKLKIIAKKKILSDEFYVIEIKAQQNL